MTTRTHPYRTHTCGELRIQNAGETVRISGWVHRQRDHGQLLFIDLRDHYGLTQCVVDPESSCFSALEAIRNESVITITGKVVERTADTVNTKMPTGQIEIFIESFELQSAALSPLPLQVNSNAEFPEETRLKYRFLDLRREKMHDNIILRSAVISSLRRRMIEQGFMEFQTPILTASSPEGARDFLVPSRIHPGQFYALPQAPQQFKQLLMVSGFDKYFQIAPCFRDEDGRADRSPGEFYQLDFEMSFVTQDDVFNAIEPVLAGVFHEFGKGRRITETPFPRIPYDVSMLKYGSDKPDLRNPIEIADVSEVFKGSDFGVFSNALEKGSVVRAIPAPHASDRPRSFFDKLNDWARELGAPGLGYIIFSEGSAKGPIAKFLDEDRLEKLKSLANLQDGDAVFFVCDQVKKAEKLAGLARTKIGEDLDIIEKDCFKFCWTVDFPMFEYNEDTKQIEFSHNPFSMPQGGMDALLNQDPLTIKAYQYDIVCNGIELSSGAIRNHLPEVMYKAFEIAGYNNDHVDEKFGGMINAFKYGAPPHGGSAPGIDRIVMLLADEPNLREIVAFPMNQQAQDLLMGAPSSVMDSQLKELNLKVVLPIKEKASA
ncbi:Aspartate--tRNA ligase [Candidatus Bealeia paramacronuclearis]|uniref:Aspartate--tRNA(Asp/Asn) ligase n=1 Tax=Candidatus Bealeia paramacronuclearis TaxID=1921001 RepID=A0ABZ2C4H9_9PROT|nr:Aspartate--tRNA ligase [Candidatus Bealeia paramacronuclearis]